MNPIVAAASIVSAGFAAIGRFLINVLVPVVFLGGFLFSGLPASAMNQPPGVNFVQQAENVIQQLEEIVPFPNIRRIRNNTARYEAALTEVQKLDDILIASNISLNNSKPEDERLDAENSVISLYRIFIQKTFFAQTGYFQIANRAALAGVIELAPVLREVEEKIRILEALQPPIALATP